MNTENNEELQIAGSPLAGDILYQAREKLGYSQKDIANRLRLRLSVIDDIENNRFDQFKLSTFTRGYVRSYAKYVGLNEEAVVSLLDKSGHARQNEQEMQSFSRRTKREESDSRIMGLTWFIAIIFIGVTAFWWWQNNNLETNFISEANESEQVQHTNGELVTTLTDEQSTLSGIEVDTTEVVENDPIIADVPSSSESTEVSSSELTKDTSSTPIVAEKTSTSDVTSDEVSEEVSEEVPTVETTAVVNVEPVSATDSAEDAVPQIVAPQVQLTFSDDCWVDVRDAKGKKLTAGIKKSGEVLDLNGEAPFRIRLGVPSAVKINVNGQPFDLSAYPSSKPVTLKLPL